MKRILVCEDEAAIRSFVVINLRRAGYETVEAGSGEDALRQYDELEGKVDLALLDIMLPGMDGFAVCKRLREKNARMGIIMLTARTQESEKVQGLRLGADDYVTKPFSPSELVARVEALLRRVEAVTPAEETITLGEMTMDLREHTVTKNGAPVDLARVEFQMLHYFFTHPNEILTRADILKKVWGEEFSGEEKIVDVNMRRLRMKVEDNPSEPRHLVTVWGQGYRWVE
ncbi:MAG: response regulator transcription factor [Clostridia bacterium]|nr:response regulator transcription factor [Clostridia bacterium]MBQ7302584.1 response regulator transcription factor [Clostridia bacterium]